MTKEEIITGLFEGQLEEEWEGFRPVDVLSPEISGKLWDRIKENTAPQQYTAAGKVRYSNFKWLAVAASVFLVAGLSWLFIFRKPKASIIPAETVATTKRIFNNTLQPMSFTLSDGSKVELSPNSTLSYPEDFNAVKRDVILKGGANFDIARDVTKPFTVYSNSVLTTVLGTRFTIKSYEANNTTVVLHDGSVMIKIANSSSRDNKKEYYLTPGDIFILNKVNAPVRINNAEHIATQKNLVQDSVSADSLSARVLHIAKDKDDSYVFNNYPLDVVFDQLQIIYNTTIIYDKSILGNRSFIGKIDKKDSLYHILKSISLLNNFGIHKQGDSIIISN